ncbi:unnamed protein product [Mytilus edulis]|uniref:C2H2-type domain-containing protein n=1 Tax=Mytilus edulis TaxID=6550 RepID=A0A8S3UC93_MYTED|nr:unnamed protein product [Mytilus edulis]
MSTYSYDSNKAVRRATVCLRCPEEHPYQGPRFRVIIHILLKHVEITQVPYYCLLCGYKTTKESQLKAHPAFHRQHIVQREEAMAARTFEGDNFYFRKSEQPYQPKPEEDYKLMSTKSTQQDPISCSTRGSTCSLDLTAIRPFVPTYGPPESDAELASSESSSCQITARNDNRGGEKVLLKNKSDQNFTEKQSNGSSLRLKAKDENRDFESLEQFAFHSIEEWGRALPSGQFSETCTDLLLCPPNLVRNHSKQDTSLPRSEKFLDEFMEPLPACNVNNLCHKSCMINFLSNDHNRFLGNENLRYPYRFSTSPKATSLRNLVLYLNELKTIYSWKPAASGRRYYGL